MNFWKFFQANAFLKNKDLQPYILGSIYYFANKGRSSQSCGFSSSYVWIWESWVPESQLHPWSCLASVSSCINKDHRSSYTSSICGCVLSHFSHIWLFMTPRTVVHQDPLSIGFFRQEYWSGWNSPGKKTRVGCHFLL